MIGSHICMINRHKVFISYHHANDQYYKELLCNMKFFNIENYKYQSIFDDYSVGNGDIDDTYLNDEQIRRIVRDEYIKNATVLVLLCGTQTKCRKHIDWEIHAAMYDSNINPKMGIIVINLPTISQWSYASEDSEKNLICPLSSSWTKFSSRSEIEERYKYLPSRIIDNLEKNIPITIVDWHEVSNNPNKLMTLIDNAYNRKDNISYDHSAPLRRHNS